MSYPKLNNEPEILERLCHGDQDAFNAFYNHYPTIMKQYIVSILPLGANELDDIIQDVFEIIWLKRESLHVVRSFRSYLFTIVRRKTLNAIVRDANRKRIFSNSLHFETPAYNTGEDHMLYKSYSKAATDAIKLLPPRIKQVYNLAMVYDLSDHEIGEELGISVQMVRKHSLKASRLIIDHLRDHSEWPDNWLPVILILMLSSN